jgi:hypothetical protein
MSATIQPFTVITGKRRAAPRESAADAQIRKAQHAARVMRAKAVGMKLARYLEAQPQRADFIENVIDHMFADKEGGA